MSSIQTIGHVIHKISEKQDEINRLLADLLSSEYLSQKSIVDVPIASLKDFLEIEKLVQICDNFETDCQFNESFFQLCDLCGEYENLYLILTLLAEKFNCETFSKHLECMFKYGELFD